MARTAGRNPTYTTRFAGFWRRGVAFLVDVLLVNVAVFIVAVGIYESGQRWFIPQFPIIANVTTIKTVDEERAAGTSTVIDRVQYIHTRSFGRWDYFALVEGQVNRSEAKLVSGAKLTTETFLSETTRLVPNAETNKLEPGFVMLSGEVALVLLFLYSAVFEATRMKGTPGKRLMRIVVTDFNGYKLSIGRSLLRNATKVFSLSLLAIGFIMAAFTKKKQGLHDFVAKTIVLQRVPGA